MNRTAIAIAAFLLAACGGQSASHSNSSTANSSTAPSGAAPTSYSSLANGREIFQTGKDWAGHPLVAATHPLRSSCAACHGTNGAGGQHIADHAVSADLRHTALVTDQKPPYNLQLLERAISTGVDNTGQPLNRVMPHWKMSSGDLHDVAAYVLTLK
ncbi:MAG TPA: cytochrome c [Candidatus Baltobacteraceae bacterium]|jgi:mono/diheme cytochrome c family protein|nr:cytochrome c [Candidatus Baltobacteraceae bacterium]